MPPHPTDPRACTMTVPMFERLATLDERSSLHKPFWKKLQKARGLAATD